MIDIADMGLRSMALLEVTAEQVLTLIQQLPAVSKRAIFELLRQEFEGSSTSDGVAPIDTNTQTWLDADLTEPLPAYEWGSEGIPKGLPIQHVAGQGVVIMGIDES
ncbi:hypothetical protein Lepto7375DRAFT_3449 [Leptolyngbya sp. PCC 7375]|nr:hypothetical protein Lepto7375DRAFT_3449 [Leptolyngbya sp. PCC 7375]